MQKVTRQEIAACLRKIGLTRGDNLLIHSAVQYLGYPEGGVKIYLEAIQDVVAEATIAVPTFTFSFARGEAYNPLESPSQSMGAFSEFVRQQPGALRTLHPMQSLAFLGPLAADLASRNTPSAFDPGSAFEGMLGLGFKLLLLGADIQSVSMVHYCEQRANVPYRHWKEFNGSVRVRDGANSDSTGWQKCVTRMFVRDLESNPQLQLSPIQALLVDREQWSETPLNYRLICSCQLAHFVQAADDLLAADPWALIGNPPQK
jgi:aminoglycoside N3'-acetyltransferase